MDEALVAPTNLWDVLKWIVICTCLIVVLIIILANVIPPPPGSSANPSAGASASAVDPCKLTCSGKDLDSAKEFYTTTGLGKMFTITPNYGVVVDENTCDINYTYNPIPGVSTGSGGIDYRRFRYSTGCNKKAIEMAAEHSGVTATSSK